MRPCGKIGYDDVFVIAQRKDSMEIQIALTLIELTLDIGAEVLVVFMMAPAIRWLQSLTQSGPH